MAFVGIGLVFGLTAALGFTRVLSSLLFRVTATDLPTLASAAGLLCLTGLAACLIPAIVAARLDPTEALRSE